jgi:hypothetical protein
VNLYVERTRNEIGSFYYTKDYVLTLLAYDMEFEPPPDVLKAIKELKPRSSSVALYEEAIRLNNIDVLNMAKERIKDVFRRYIS